MPIKASIEPWAIKFAQLINLFGTIKASILFVFLTLLFTLVGSYLVRMSMSGVANAEDFIGALGGSGYFGHSMIASPVLG